MASLARDLRQELEKTVKQARRVAKTGARKMLEQHGVHHREPYDSMSPEQRALRNGLRAHGRQLGDRRDPQKNVQTIGRLSQECAYEHWHRMLFARFLAEADLLIEPKSGVAITLEECQELAREEGADWLALAGHYAQGMLPQIFRKNAPVLAVTLPPETRSELEDLLKALPRDVFTADDSLGWVYQFWQAEEKEAVNKSEKKVGADELPAVTQLFTEDYMVLFLLHNTLGAWWAGKVLAERPELAITAKSEDELRRACKIGDMSFNYLRFVRDKAEDGTEGPWRPAAGTFDGWPRAAKDVTVLDPCMGSGHFLVFALPILVAFRITEEGLDREASVEAVLRDNLFGLEIDQRCTQIAAFNLAFAAWRMVGHRPLPKLNLACSGLSIGVSKAEWLRLAEKAAMAGDPAANRDMLGAEENLLTIGLAARVRNGLDALYDLFAKAPWIGSLIDPRDAAGDIFKAEFAQLEPLLGSILATAESDEIAEMAVAAQGMAKAAELLRQCFTLTVTNVPFLGSTKQDPTLRSHTKQHFGNYSTDLATCMLRRCIDATEKGGTIATVSSQSWLFMKPYSKMRYELLKNITWNFVARLGEHGFSSPQAAGAFVALVAWTKGRPDHGQRFLSCDAADLRDVEQKEKSLVSKSIGLEAQVNQLSNPDCRITLGNTSTGSLLMEYADAYKGIATGDIERFISLFWEFQNPKEFGFEFLQGAPDGTQNYGGRSEVLRWQEGDGDLHKFVAEKLGGNIGAWIRGEPAWSRRGVAIGQVRSLPATLYTGEFFDENTAAIIPKDDKHLEAIWAFCSSENYPKTVRSIDQSLKVPSLTLLKVPFDLSHWQNVVERNESNLASNAPIADPSQWLFCGEPKSSDAPLLVGTMRLLGYRWPRQVGFSFAEWPAVAPDKVDFHADDDGIVCLTAIKGEAPAHERLNALLADAFGADWSATKLASLLADAGFAGRALDDWLRDSFFEQHCTLFHQRPFIWHLWDGRRDGFHALVNYHRLAAPGGEGRRTLEKLIYSYLGDWIDRQRADRKAGTEGADGRLAAAEHLRSELTKILEGEPPYDIFVRWKPLHQQPIGWEPDINDGVRMNIRPFLTARPLSARAKTTCILRSTPRSLKWDKDRGKEPMRDQHDYPWFWGWDEAKADFAGGAEFDGIRWNELHYSRALKETSRNQNRRPIGHTE
jgi:hypothetical protein